MAMTKTILYAFALLGLSALPPVVLTAAAQPVDVKHGRALAEVWCVNCHVIDREQTTAVPAGPPPFPALADNPDMTADALSGFIREPHPPMPDMSLTNVEVQDLVGYIQSLKE
jgi:mono/diheme cytochrome c family protein